MTARAPLGMFEVAHGPNAATILRLRSRLGREPTAEEVAEDERAARRARFLTEDHEPPPMAIDVRGKPRA